MQQQSIAQDDTAMILIKSFCAGLGSGARGEEVAEKRCVWKKENEQQTPSCFESPDCVAQASLSYVTPLLLG